MLVYAGTDGKWNCLTESTTDEAEGQRILRPLSAEVDVQRGAQTKATLGTDVDPRLKIHEAEARPNRE